MKDSDHKGDLVVPLKLQIIINCFYAEKNRYGDGMFVDGLSKEKLMDQVEWAAKLCGIDWAYMPGTFFMSKGKRKLEVSGPFAVRLTPPQRCMLDNIVEGREYTHGLSGKSAFGGAVKTLYSLRRLGCIVQCMLPFGPTGAGIKSLAAVQKLCSHGMRFSQKAARGLSVAEVRAKWPRLFGKCPKGCGYSGIAYASTAHFVFGGW